jgi:hypothetical protein
VIYTDEVRCSLQSTRFVFAGLHSFAAITLLAHAGHAGDHRLTYERGAGTETCPSEAALRDAVKVRLGYDPFVPEGGPRIAIVMTRSKGGHHASIDLFSTTEAALGHRELESFGNDCSELARSVTLAVSLAIDPLANSGSPGPEASAASTSKELEPPLSPQQQAPAMVDKPVNRQPESPKTERSSSAGLYVGGGAMVGSVAPSAALAPVLGAELSYRALRFALEGHLQLDSERSVRTNLGTEGAVSASAFGATTLACVNVQSGFGICLAPTLGSLRATGKVERGTEESALYVRLGVRALYDVWVTRNFALVPFVEAHATLTPVEARFQESVVWQSAPLGAFLGVLVKARIL